MPRIIVVGAGSAGCVVAARLTESSANEVLLIESGPDRSNPALASVNWLDAMSTPDAFHTELTGTRLAGAEPSQYHRGRGVGGSASVNAMLALPGLPTDYERWVHDHDLDQWSWHAVEPWFARLKNDLIASARDDYTPVDTALVDAAASLGLPGDVDTYSTPDDGGGALWRNATSTGRHSSREAYLAPALTRPNLRIRADSEVDSVLLHDGSATGVRLKDGTRIDADEVVLCAGTIETPAILLRTEGYNRDGVGKGLQDHPAASVLLSLKPEFRVSDPALPCIGAVLRLSSSIGDGDVHLLPLHGCLDKTAVPHHGLVMAALMTVTSTGEVRLNPDNPQGPPVIEENLLSTEHDRTAMRDAIVHLTRVLRTEPFQRITDEVFIDAHGTPLTELHGDDAYQQWLRSSVGDYFHAVGTARMGPAHDARAVVDQRGRVHGVQNLRVIDASIMPEVPSANTHLPVVMIAERLSAAMLTDHTQTGAEHAHSFR
ncbi:choline dehydrogenase-like flavoprotein [Prauserella sp. Am3]|nr:choline dehydrogenase-like flavoprotein [Prauserella sp. Am3]